MARPKLGPVLKVQERLPWPTHPKELKPVERSFRVHRMNAFEWQAYVIQDNEEFPIGKPDTFDLILKKVTGIMRIEGECLFRLMKAKGESVQ